jgi:DNA-binding NarL/FixJ family response regulator
MLTKMDTLTQQDVSPALKSLSLLKLLSYIQAELGTGKEEINEESDGRADIHSPISTNAQSFFLGVKKMIDDPDFKTAFLHAIDRLYQKAEVHDWQDYNLTKRETEIAELLLKGYSYKEIASKLFICMDTIFSHIRNIYSKIHVHSRSEMAAKFI